MLTTRSGRPVSRIGLGGKPNAAPVAVGHALAAGVNCFFYYAASHRGLTGALRNLFGNADSADMFVVSGSQEREVAQLDRTLDELMAAVDRPYLDAFLLEYVAPTEDLARIRGDGGLLEQLARWRQQGRLRYVGISTHDRGVATALVGTGKLDLLMVRYNMAHRRAEAEVLPAAAAAQLPVIAFTATRWGTLLQGHRQWPHQPPSAVDCYRFALGAPAVRLVLTAPESEAQLHQNLRVLESPAMSADERQRWSEYGDLIYGTGTDSFEREWP